MKKLLNWLGFGLRGELEKSRISLGVAREISDDWQNRAKVAQERAIQLILENEKLKSENKRLNEQYEQQQRAAAKLGQALSSRVVTVEGLRK